MLKLSLKFSGQILLIAIGISFSKCSITQPNQTAFSTPKIPTINEVGALRMPVEIAPVSAPFKMPQFKRPTFPNRSINIFEKNAKKGVITTKEIQAAIDDLTKQDGGTVIVPAGKWNLIGLSQARSISLRD